LSTIISSNRPAPRHLLGLGVQPLGLGHALAVVDVGPVRETRAPDGLLAGREVLGHRGGDAVHGEVERPLPEVVLVGAFGREVEDGAVLADGSQQHLGERVGWGDVDGGGRRGRIVHR
jgi:hypothetical protein